MALVAAMPLVAAMRPAEFLSTQIANEVFSYLAAAGVLMALCLAIRKSVEGQRLRDGIGATLCVAALAFALIYLMMVPMLVTVHRLVPTPERLIATVIASIVLLPFFLSFRVAGQARRSGDVDDAGRYRARADSGPSRCQPPGYFSAGRKSDDAVIRDLFRVVRGLRRFSLQRVQQPGVDRSRGVHLARLAVLRVDADRDQDLTRPVAIAIISDAVLMEESFAQLGEVDQGRMVLNLFLPR
jgi:hypothetical protein